MGKISIYQGIYDVSSVAAFKRDGYLHEGTKRILSLPDRFETLLFAKGVKFFLKYGYIEFYFTLGKDAEKGIEAIAICHPFFNVFDEELGETIVIGRIKRMRGDVKYETNKPKRDKHGKIVLENKKPIIQHRIKYYRPYNLDAKVLDKNGNEIDKLKYPFVYKIDT